MADRNELLAVLSQAEPDDAPVALRVSELDTLYGSDLPPHVGVEPCVRIDATVREPALEGSLYTGENSPVTAIMRHDWWRRYWGGSLGVVDYRDLVRRAVEARAAGAGGVALLEVDEDDLRVSIGYSIEVQSDRLDQATAEANRVDSEMREIAEAVNQGIGDSVTRATRRLEGWGDDPLHKLIDRMGQGSAHQKGVRLEELTSRLLGTIPGFRANGRVRTATEEIDIHVQNESDDPVWRRESALLLAECKNWSTVCGREQFSVFKEKLRGRVGRVSCGFLVSWNGFAETVEKEMLRGSEGDLLVVPITGSDLRVAVREGDFPDRLKTLRQNAVLL